jgi:eukaryotic-like serine/threonine-protein kinase
LKKRLVQVHLGTVYQVLCEDDDKFYALKELRNMEPVVKQRFEREIKGLSQLDHSNIVKIIQWNIDGDPPNFNPYYVMEYLGGGSLRQYMDEKFRGDHRYQFDTKWTINKIILPVCNAFAHIQTKENVY